jgi:hypothetical protein
MSKICPLSLPNSYFILSSLSAIFRASCGNPKIMLAEIVGGVSGPEFGSKNIS